MFCNIFCENEEGFEKLRNCCAQDLRFSSGISANSSYLIQGGTKSRFDESHTRCPLVSTMKSIYQAFYITSQNSSSPVFASKTSKMELQSKEWIKFIAPIDFMGGRHLYVRWQYPLTDSRALFDGFKEKGLGKISLCKTAYFHISKRPWPEFNI